MKNKVEKKKENYFHEIFVAAWIFLVAVFYGKFLVAPKPQLSSFQAETRVREVFVIQNPVPRLQKSFLNDRFDYQYTHPHSMSNLIEKKNQSQLQLHQPEQTVGQPSQFHTQNYSLSATNPGAPHQKYTSILGVGFEPSIVPGISEFPPASVQGPGQAETPNEKLHDLFESISQTVEKVKEFEFSDLELVEMRVNFGEIESDFLSNLRDLILRRHPQFNLQLLSFINPENRDMNTLSGLLLLTNENKTMFITRAFLERLVGEEIYVNLQPVVDSCLMVNRLMEVERTEKKALMSSIQNFNNLYSNLVSFFQTQNTEISNLKQEIANLKGVKRVSSKPLFKPFVGPVVKFYTSKLPLPVTGSFNFKTYEFSIGLGKAIFKPVGENSPFGLIAGLDAGLKFNFKTPQMSPVVSGPEIHGFVGIGYRV